MSSALWNIAFGVSIGVILDISIEGVVVSIAGYILSKMPNTDKPQGEISVVFLSGCGGGQTRSIPRPSSKRTSREYMGTYTLNLQKRIHCQAVTRFLSRLLALYCHQIVVGQKKYTLATDTYT